VGFRAAMHPAWCMAEFGVKERNVKKQKDNGKSQWWDKEIRRRKDTETQE
jgi:hypothetical protein